ncbi:HD domain-containing protein [Oceanobacillus saliphilus]|uniref:HD domain-containing protein n=1 Tax=Oceanobacillus saliphilus TaxID=2925834 RepID=UPI00201D4ABF|nr:HD domain-containing protein [Oceanobacillus saliphilus]
MKEKQLSRIREYVRQLFHDDATGHDFFHMERVANMAKQIAEAEKANLFICEAAGLLHDIGDQKLFSNPNKAIDDMGIFLNSISMSSKEIACIKRIIKDVSFSKGEIPDQLEGKIVQDSDRLDAIGAIGVARTFAYGGANNQMIHHPELTSTSIQHFYDKLLKLKQLMNTDTAKEIAEERHRFMETYLKQFFHEWN